MDLGITSRQQEDETKKRVLLKWVSMRVGRDITELSQFVDGDIFTELLQHEDPHGFYQYELTKRMGIGQRFRAMKKRSKKAKQGDRAEDKLLNVVKYMEAAMGTGNFRNGCVQGILQGGQGVLTFIQRVILIVVIRHRLTEGAVQYDSDNDRFLAWVNTFLTGREAKNFTRDWIDGKRIWTFLRNFVARLDCNFQWSREWNDKNISANITFCLQVAEENFYIRQLISASDLTLETTPAICLITYLSQYLVCWSMRNAGHRQLTNKFAEYTRIRFRGVVKQPSNDGGYESIPDDYASHYACTSTSSGDGATSRTHDYEEVFTEKFGDKEIKCTHEYENLDAFSKEPIRATVICSYEATYDGEIDLVDGDIIEVTEKTDDNWWVGRSNGKVGTFPANSVRPTTDTGSNPGHVAADPVPRDKTSTYFDQYALKYSDEVEKDAIDVLKQFHGRSYFLIKALKRSEQLDIRKPAIKEGEFSQVFRAQLHDEEKALINVAAKRMKEQYRKQEVELIKEAEVMLKLNHAHIMPLSGLVWKDKFWNLLQPWMVQGDLHGYVSNKRELTVSHLLVCAADVACAMEQLDEVDIVHRDLAARNCLVDKNGRVRVSDFCFARCVFQGPYQKQGELGLPFQWQAPEVLEEFKYSSKSDCWSFGVLLWELMSRGEAPYGEMTSTNVSMFVVRGGRLAKPQLATDDIYDLMMRCWQDAPDSRPEFGQVSADLEDISRRIDASFTSKDPQIFSDREVVTMRKWHNAR